MTNGMLPISMRTRIAGERANKNGLVIKRWVVRVRVEEVVCIWRGR